MHGPTLVVAPMVSTARNIAARLRHRGASTALVPDDWARAASGVDVVVGARSAVWTRIDGLASIVVVDEHDDSLQEERTPTWHARDVAIERAQRLGIPCLLVSPVPTIAARVAAGNRHVVLASGVQWPTVRVIDRSRDERWGSSLLSGELIDVLRDPAKRIVCVLNTKGRARLLTCNSCTRIVRCETCDAAMAQPDPDRLACPRCSATRPVVCADCGATALRAVRRGVSRLRDELEAAAGRRVVEVGTVDERVDAAASVFVGTEAVLHRIDDADVVVLLDVDGELLAPRFRAAEATLELVVHAARRVRSASDGVASGEVWLQTHHPDHDLLDGLRRGDLTGFVDAETQRRRALSLPPFGALARISGPGADDAAEQLTGSMYVSVARRDGEVLVRAATYDTLADELAHLARAKNSRWRVAVDPPRV
jgi:primosomal protein N' (replication factor Y)